MEAPVVVEILDRFGKVRERHKVKTFPVRIGRSYKNDIIIDDQFVSPQHIELMLDGDGHILATDLNSDNGMFTVHPVVRHDILTVVDNQRIRIGHTDIRIRAEDYSVKETVIDHGRPSQWHLLMTNGFILPLVWCLMIGVFLSNQYFDTVGEVHFNKLLAEEFEFLIFILLWTFVWSIISKVITHEFYFAYHGIHAGLLFTGYYFVKLAFEYLEFIFPISGLQGILTFFSDFIFITLLIYGHLRQSTHLNRRKSKSFSFVASMVYNGLLYLFIFVNQPTFSGQPSYSGLIKPPAFVIMQPTTVDEFFANSTELVTFTLNDK